MKSVGQLKKLFSGKLKRNVRSLLLKECRDEDFTEIAVPLSALADDFDGNIKKYKSWFSSVCAYVENIDGAELEFKQSTWKCFGFSLKVPIRIRIASAKALFAVASPTPCTYAVFTEGVAILKKISKPYAQALQEVLAKDFYMITAENAKTEVEKLCALISWLDHNLDANCYLREIPIAGIDTKWFEKHRGIVAQALSKLYGIDLTASNLFEYWQIKQMPTLMRVRHADLFTQGIGDQCVMLSAGVLNRAIPKALVVIENIATGMSIDVPKDVAIIFGLGRNIAALAEITWINQVPLFYMGDLDVHGLIIVSELRRVEPKAITIMMDLSTLKQWSNLCVLDPTQDLKKGKLERLTDDEQALYQELLHKRLRLEQERIDIGAINRAFSQSLINI